jgi:nucleoside-diphosphate-sugar epimerase
MTRTAFVLGGTGMIGRAVVPQLLERGYEVTIGSRKPASLPDGVRHVTVDRKGPDGLGAITGDFDVFVDVIAYDGTHGRQLCELEGRIGSLVFISSASVYADDTERMLAGSDFEPTLPIDETRPVVAAAPDGSDYAGGKVAIENTLLEEEPAPVTILRPGAVFGPGDQASREWHFVKRVLDGRKDVALAFGGKTIFHPVSSANVASMVALAADLPGSRIVNCGDPEPWTVREICDGVAQIMNHDWRVHIIDGPPESTIGDTPWSAPYPFVMDLSVAQNELGFAGVVPFGDWLATTCRWLVEATRDRPWEEVLPRAALYYPHQFDYAAEDDFFERMHRQ